jgi:hypothetical protein
MLLPGSSWLHPNVPNAGGKGQPSHRAGEPFRLFGPGHRNGRAGRMPAGPPVDWPDVGAWCNGSTTGSGPVSRGSNPCAPAPGPRTGPRGPARRANPPTPRRGSSRTGPASARLRFVSRRHRQMSTCDVDTPMSVLPYGCCRIVPGANLRSFTRSLADTPLGPTVLKRLVADGRPGQGGPERPTPPMPEPGRP